MLMWISLAIQPLSQQNNTYNKENKGLQENQSAQSAFTVSTRNKVQHLCPTGQRHHQAKRGFAHALTLQ